MTAGAGWIALALVVFASWQPLRLFIGAYVFGGVTIIQLNLQALGLEINVALLSMSPYLVTIGVLVFMSARQARGSLNAPGSLGKTFYNT
jgi:simple sugar transport system permease protein